MGRRNWLRWVLPAAALVLVSAAGLSAFYIDVLWFRTLGYDQVFWHILLVQAAAGVAAGLIFGGIFFLNLAAALRSLVRLPFGALPPRVEAWLRARPLTLAALVVSLVLGAVAGLATAAEWQTVELFRNRQMWGVPDPIFGRDVGFYVFEMPFYRLALGLAGPALVLSLLAAGVVYLVSGALQFQGPRLAVHPRARLHVALLAAALLVLKAVQYWLDAFDLVHSTRGAGFGAGYTDIHAQLPALRILAVLALAAAAGAVAAGLRRNLRPLYLGLAGLLVGSLALGSMWPALMQRFVVEPNELARERPYLARTIEFTRRAFGLDRIQTREHPGNPRLTWADLERQQGTLENIRLWDYRPLLQTYRGVQNLRPYYDFHDVDIDRYVIDGRPRQVLISARELDHRQLPQEAQTWVNIHLKYTHGYGAVMSPAAEVGPGGQPVFFLRDIPPQSSVAGLEVTRPEIYYGEVIEPFAVVRTQEAEFDYPLGTRNATTFYEGRGGIPIGPFINRLAFALWTGDYNLILSTQLTGESRALIHRRVQDRIRRVAPFLRYDRDPYLVIGDDGRLFWMQDAYTVAYRYPYADPYRGRFAGPELYGANYVRNSVKVVVDAYHGDVDFYVFDETDPMIRAYRQAFPTLFQPAEAMREDLRRHVRYPEDLLRLQAEMLLTYHMTDVDTFYNKEDPWALPTELVAGEQALVEPYYLIMQLPDEPEPEFLLLLPFTPADREDFMIGWLAARSDLEHYGQLIAFEMPKQRPVSSPLYIEKLINQHPEIAQDLTLWSSQGNRVIRGNLLVIPIEDGILYVEPLYLQAGDRGRPELTRVIVSLGSEVAMAETFADALAAVLGGPASEAGDGGPTAPVEEPGGPAAGRDPEPGGDPRQAELIERAADLYRRAQERLRAGDLAGYAGMIEELGTVLERLVEMTGVETGGEPPAEPTPAGGS